VDPSGRLPLTFPATEASARAASGDGFPGVNGTVRYASGLDIGYRWYEAHGIRPLFPFGYGLSYTSFALSRVSLQWTGNGELARMTVTDTGKRSGTGLVEIYVRFPDGAGEPPRQLAGFQTVSLNAGASRQITVTLPLRNFEVFLKGRFRTVRGRYLLGFGQSSSDLTTWLATTVPPATPRVPRWVALAIGLAVIGLLGTVGYRFGTRTTRGGRAATAGATGAPQSKSRQ
jgi:beta-glucosidase